MGQKYHDFDKKTLMLIVIVDSICLLLLLQDLESHNKRRRKVHEEFSLMILDLMMLENQIPIPMTLQVIQHRNPDKGFFKVVDILFDMVYNSISRLSLVKLSNDDRELMRKICGPPQRLLHFMYSLVVGRKLAAMSQYGNKHPGLIGKISPESTGSDILQQTGESLVYAWKQAREFFIQAIGEILSAIAATKAGGLNVPEWLDKSVQSVMKAMSFTNHKKLETAILCGVYEGHHQTLEIICTVIRNVKDVQMLKDAKVIEMRLKDEDVVKLFKSMKISTEKLGKKSEFIDVFGKYMNQDYDNHPVIKARNWIKKWALALVNFVK
nr:uncharacterized protein LOC113708182 [Coffea arabica]